MKIRLKPIAEQVIVITGASSGIGLATAREAARRGARVVLTSRNERALRDVTKDIIAAGGEAMWVSADVADPHAVERVARETIDEFGGIDTWVNNASSAIYGRLWEMDLEDKQRLFQVNFWGMVHGCRAALPWLMAHGGAIVNVGSVVSSQAIPLLGMYSATKHAVKAYTDTLRMELEDEGAPVSVTLVKPASTDTPFFDHAKSEMGATPKPVPPVYAPEVVADVILHCAERRTREIQVGGAGTVMSAMGTLSQGLTERIFARTLTGGAQRDDRPRVGTDNLHEPSDFDGVVHGNYDGHVMRSSLYARSAMHPLATALSFLGVGAVAALGLAALRARRRRTDADGDAGADLSDDLPLDATAFDADGEFEPPPPARRTRRASAVSDEAEGMLHAPGGNGR